MNLSNKRQIFRGGQSNTLLAHTGSSAPAFSRQIQRGKSTWSVYAFAAQALAPGRGSVLWAYWKLL